MTSQQKSSWLKKSVILIGIILLLIGIASLVLPEFSYTTQEKLLDLGPIHATKETKRNILIPPVIGIVMLIGGVLITALGFLWKKKS